MSEQAPRQRSKQPRPAGAQSGRRPSRKRPARPALAVDEGYSVEDDGLPHCIGIASLLADALEAAALAPFPDTHIVMNFASKETTRGGLAKVRKRIDAAAGWADRIADVCGPMFMPRSDVVVEQIAGYTIRLLFAKSDEPPRSWYARDVLGEPPDTLRRKCGTAMLRQMRAGCQNDPFASQGADVLDNDRMALLAWRAQFESEVRKCYLPIRAQALALVAWLRARIDELTSAALPTVQLPADDRKARSCDVVVSLAGRSRPRRITSNHLILLGMLARTGEGRAYRKEVRGTHAQSLETRIPELRGLIDTVPGSSDTDNRATYRVNDALQARIRLPPVTGPRGK